VKKMVEAAEEQYGRLMETDGGASIIDLIVRDGNRQSIFRSYTFPYMDNPNLTVLTQQRSRPLCNECAK